jgi:feruloyl esterase
MAKFYDFLARILTSLLLAVPYLGIATAAPGADTCAGLIETLNLNASVKIILTEAYPNNSTFQDPYSLSYPTPAPFLPEFCRVYANISTSPFSASLFEVWMPIATWNGRYMTVGNGGAAGGVAYPALGAGLRAGYAVASTDGGHNSSVIAGDWQADNEEVIIDFGW